MTIGKTIENFKVPFVWYDLYNINFGVNVVIHLCLLALGIIGMCIVVFNKRFVKCKLKYVLIALVVFFNVVHLPYYCFARYVYPIMPIVIGFATISIVYIVDGLKRSK